MSKIYIILIGISIVVFLTNLNGNSIYILDEAKNAGCAAEMLKEGNFIVPTFNGNLRTDKPPLHYYMMMLPYKALGFTPLAARLFSGIAGICLIIALYYHTSKILNKKTALFTCLILLSSIQIAIQFRLAVPDPYLILFISLTILFFYKGLYHNSNSILLCYVFTGLGFLTKGPIAILLPGFIFFLFLISTQQFNWKTLKQLKIMYGLLIIFVITAPWYYMVGYATDGQWLREFFLGHNLERFTSTMEGHKGFIGAPFLLMFIGLLPFSVFSVPASIAAWKKRKSNTFIFLCLLTVIVFGVFFSFSKTLLPSYPAPALPFLAIITANYMQQIFKRKKALVLRLRTYLITNGVIVLGIPFLLVYALSTDLSLQPITPLISLFTVLSIGSLIGWIYIKKEQPMGLVLSWASSWIMIIILFFQVILPKIDATNPVTESIALLNQKYSAYKIVGYKKFNPAFVFNLHQQVPTFHNINSIDSMVSKNEKVIILTRYNYWKELDESKKWEIVYHKNDLFEKSQTILVAN